MFEPVIMLKSKFNTERVSVQVGILFSKVGISPNMWTLFGLIPAGLGFLSLYYHNLIYALIFFVISGFIDAIDGAVARVVGRTSNLGAFLDGIIDRYVEIMLYVGLLFYGLTEFLLPSSFWISALIFGAIMPTYVRAYADHKHIVTEPEDQKKMGGLMERPERLILIYVGMLIGNSNQLWLTYVIILTAVLSNLTALQRIAFVIGHKD